MRVLVSAASDSGRIRGVNEDSFYYARASDGAVFALVADGMGGARGGKVASEMAAKWVPDLYLRRTRKYPAALRRSFLQVNKRIYSRSRKDPSIAGMGTTCLALDVSPPDAWAAWVGDSRLYLIRDRRIFQLTEDHSLVQEMVRRGMMASEAAGTHEDRNLVTRALGSKPKVEVSVWQKPFPLRLGDRLILATDGLHDMLSDDEILALSTHGAIETACRRLIEAANGRGGHDNISVVILEIAGGGPDSTGDLEATREAAVWNGVS